MHFRFAQLACVLAAVATLAGSHVLSAGAAGDTTPPSAPTGLAATAIGNAIDLSWSPSTDNVAVDSYTVWRDGVWQGITRATHYTFAGLTCGTTYELRVAAYDTSGNLSTSSALRATACATTTAPGVSAPTALATSSAQ